MKKQTIKAQCSSCSGSGLYRGFCEAPDEPVVCITCGGTGCEEITFTPYTGRKRKRGVKKVRYSGGGFLATGVGGVDGTEMTYAEFLKAIPEPSP